MTQRDYLATVYRENVEEDTFLLRYYDIGEHEGKEVLILGFLSLDHLLKRRQIVPEDDPLGADGYSTKAGFAERVMNAYVNEQAVNPALNPLRRIAGLTTDLGDFHGNQTFQRRTYEDNLLDVLKDIATTSDWDFTITHTGSAQFFFTGQQVGSDKSKETNFPLLPFVLFDVRRGNLQEPHLVVNAYEEINYVYMGAQGPEDDREWLPASDPDAIALSPWGRIEGSGDARESSDSDEILNSGAVFLKEHKAMNELEFEPDLQVGGAIYRDHWDLGDVVSAQYKGFEQRVRVTEVEVTASGTGETIKPTLENYDAG